MVGFLVCILVPPLKNYETAFVFLGANAVIWTLIELKNHLLSSTRVNSYKNMRAARLDIIRSIIKSLKSRNDTTITIIGGRIRTISDMLREIGESIHKGEISARNTKINLFCFDSQYILSILPKATIRDREAFEKRFLGYKEVIDQLRNETSDIFSRPEMAGNNLKIETFLYKDYPYFYAYIIDGVGVYWGYFTWNEKTEDFEGPQNPCYYVDETNEGYDDLCAWIQNRAAFYRQLNAEVEQPNLPDAASN